MMGRIALKHGATRLVLLIGPYAIKVPYMLNGWKLFLWGLLGNMQEAEFSRAGWQELCPVLWRIPGGWCNIMLRAKELTAKEFESLEPVLEAWADCDDYRVPVEVKPSSFGWIGMRLVAIDYGSDY